jgi:hypothetical protein
LNDWSNELRLALTLVLNAALWASAFRFARRRGGAGMLQAVCDALLIYFVVQYASVALPGAFGVFNLWTMSLLALVASAALWVGAGSEPNRKEALWTADHLIFLTCATFLTTYLAAHIYDKRFHPPLATDPIVYHLPTAVQWIQTGKLGIFPTWYWNPAATYSPAPSSTFMAWLMAPTRNDVFVRFVQAPPLLFIFFLVARLCRQFGASRAVAGLIALAAALSRPFFSEATIPKDDLFITAFFGAAVLSLASSNLKDKLAPCRVGLAFGMVLACKYTVLLVCPLFLFMIDAPFRAGWRARHWLTALAIGITLFAPWYVRNIVVTGNPLFPVDVKLFGHTIFPGLFGTERDQQLRTAGGVWKMLGETYHSIPSTLLAALCAGLLAAIIAAGRSLLRDPLRRACLIGTVVTFVVFLITSPHHEVRYMYPLLLLIFTTLALPIAGWIRLEAARITLAVVLSAIAILTGFEWGVIIGPAFKLLAFAFTATLVVACAAFAQIVWIKLDRIRLALVGAGLVAAGLMPLYVLWTSYLRDLYHKTAEGFGEAGISYAWTAQYPREAPLWTFVRENVPDDATIAIANTYFVYPFQDAGLKRRLGYAPTRRDLHDLLGFPRMGDTVPGDLIVQRMTAVQNTDPDKTTWLENLSRMNAQYLVIAAFEHEPNPPEKRFVAEQPERFETIFSDPEAGAVYRIKLSGPH